jgi:hypothetical protein
MEIDLNFQIKGLNGKEIKEDHAHAGALLGNQLAAHNKGEAIKWYDWGRNLFNKKPINVDRSDFDKILNFVQNTDMLTNAVKAQIEEKLIAIKDKEDKKTKK